MGWKDIKFTEVAQLINGRAYSQPELLDSGKYRVVRVGNLSGGDRWFFSDMELDDNEYCNKGDLLFSWACNFGPYIWDKEKTIFHYHIWKLILEEAKINKYFFYYYLKYKTPYMLGNVNGSVMVHITKGTMEKEYLHIPELGEQEKIASILSSLDAKIENNNKINANLEAQAQALFKSWFVDFEPFQNGEFEDSELGRIPKGWKVESLNSFGSVICGKTPSKSVKKYYGTDVPFIKIPDMHGKVFIIESEDNLSLLGSESQINK